MRPLYTIAMVAAGPFPGLRGSQILVRELAESLAALGHSVHVVAYGAGEEATSTPGVRVHRTPAFLGGASVFGPHPWRLILNCFLLATLYRVVRDHRVQVIHAHNYEAPALGYVIRFFLGIPVLYHAHNLMGDELAYYFRRPVWRRLAGHLGRWLDRFLPRRADWVVALSDAMADELRDCGVAAERLAVIPPGVFTNGDGAGPPRWREPGAKVIAYAGNLDAYQDVPRLVRAMAEVRRVEPAAALQIITHASNAAITRQVESLGLGDTVRVVVMDGWESVQMLLQRADVLVCPRSSWSGFPIKLVNYMAAGRPIVVSAGAARALGEGPWIVVADSDAGGLARALLSALGDPLLRRRLGGAARQVAHDTYDWGKLAPRVAEVYDHLVVAAVGDA